MSTDDADALVPMSSLNNYSYNYNSNCRYYLKQTDFEDYFGTEQSPEQIIRILDDPYYQLTTDQICNLILRKKPNQYYIRDTTKYVPLDYVRLDPQVVFRYITWMSLPKLTDY